MASRTRNKGSANKTSAASRKRTVSPTPSDAEFSRKRQHLDYSPVEQRPTDSLPQANPPKVLSQLSPLEDAGLDVSGIGVDSDERRDVGARPGAEQLEEHLLSARSVRQEGQSLLFPLGSGASSEFVEGSSSGPVARSSSPLIAESLLDRADFESADAGVAQIPLLASPPLPITSEQWGQLNGLLDPLFENVISHIKYLKAELIPARVALIVAIILSGIASTFTQHIKTIIPDFKLQLEDSREILEARLNHQLDTHEAGPEALVNLFQEALNSRDWARICNLKALRRPLALPSMTEQVAAMEKSWVHPFIGDASRSLWEHITFYYDPRSFNNDTAVYANYCSVFQSSGMGKSRTVDEMSKTHFTIMCNLRDGRTQGFPAADNEVREFLREVPYKPLKGHEGHSDWQSQAVFYRCAAFLKCVLRKAADEVAKLRATRYNYSEEQIAARFREMMCENQGIDSQGPFRKQFFKEVIDNATRTVKGKKERLDYSFGSVVECQQLVELLKGDKGTLPSKKGSSNLSKDSKGKRKVTTISSSTAATNDKEKIPHVILVFDEAHSLERFNFDTLRLALRGLNTMEVFSLFLSTMGKVDQFTPAQDHDQSTRINIGVIKSIPPYTDLGYDHLMKENPFDPDSGLLLGEAVKDGYMANHGRPLLGTQYQHGSDDVKKGIIAFAKMKLLNENIVAIYSEKEDCKLKSLDTLLTSQQKFACLSQRLALQFHSINYILPEDREQVESHMRICLEVDERLKTMKSTSGSEPLLAEAAAELMQDFDPVTALVPVLSGFSIHVGDRGDLVASVILLLHRDAVVRKAIEHGKGKEEARVVPLLDYLTTLFPTAREDILKARPSGGKVPTSKKFTLKDDLQGACFHFNHQCEVHDDGVVKRVYMVRFHSRSAMIICGNCQSGIVDLMFAFCASSPKLSIKNTGLVLVQVTLDSRDTYEPDWSLHDLMDPARLQLFDGEEPEDHKTPVPIIRIVFAFGAKTAAVHVRPQPPAAERAKDARFRTYDIWCSGMSSRTLGPVNNISSWEALLARVDIWHSIFSTSKVDRDGRQLVSPMKSNLRKQQMTGAAEMPAFFSQWVEDKRGLCPDKLPKTERSTRSRPQN